MNTRRPTRFLRQSPPFAILGIFLKGGDPVFTVARFIT
jgi:hypothetical protein